MPEKSPEPRHKLEFTGSQVIISMPSRKNWLQIASLVLFTAFWVIITIIVPIIALSSQVSRENKGYLSFMMLNLVIWVTGGILNTYVLLWQTAGKEVLTISREGISLGRFVFGVGKAREYAAEYIRDMRVSAPNLGMDAFGFGRYGAMLGINNGLLAFDYGSKTIRCGSGVDEAEVKQIIHEITRQYPQYAGRV